jgi:hypothetical protein
VNNPDHVTQHIRQILLDEELLNTGSIPLLDDNREHRVVVTMGNPED